MTEESALPYVALLAGRDPLHVLRETPAALDAVLAGFPHGEWDQPTAPGKWSLREILCHLADCEIAWAWRFRYTFGEDAPHLQPFDQDRWATAYRGTGFTADLALTTWRALRAFNLAFLETLSPEDLEKLATHPEGDRSLRALVSIAAGHDLHHLKGLAALQNQSRD